MTSLASNETVDTIDATYGDFLGNCQALDNPTFAVRAGEILGQTLIAAAIGGANLPHKTQLWRLAHEMFLRNRKSYEAARKALCAIGCGAEVSRYKVAGMVEEVGAIAVGSGQFIKAADIPAVELPPDAAVPYPVLINQVDGVPVLKWPGARWQFSSNYASSAVRLSHCLAARGRLITAEELSAGLHDEMLDQFRPQAIATTARHFVELSQKWPFLINTGDEVPAVDPAAVFVDLRGVEWE